MTDEVFDHEGDGQPETPKFDWHGNPLAEEEELTPEQLKDMEIRLKELCLDCFGDGWVYYPAYPAKAPCEACNGTGKVTPRTNE